MCIITEFLEIEIDTPKRYSTIIPEIKNNRIQNELWNVGKKMC